MGKFARTEHLFVIRVWREAGWEADTPWRGFAQHIGSGERQYFASLTDLMDFMTRRLREEPPASRPGKPVSS